MMKRHLIIFCSLLFVNRIYSLNYQDITSLASPRNTSKASISAIDYIVKKYGKVIAFYNVRSKERRMSMTLIGFDPWQERETTENDLSDIQYLLSDYQIARTSKIDNCNTIINIEISDTIGLNNYVQNRFNIDRITTVTIEDRINERMLSSETITKAIVLGPGNSEKIIDWKWENPVTYIRNDLENVNILKNQINGKVSKKIPFVFSYEFLNDDEYLQSTYEGGFEGEAVILLDSLMTMNLILRNINVMTESNEKEYYLLRLTVFSKSTLTIAALTISIVTNNKEAVVLDRIISANKPLTKEIIFLMSNNFISFINENL